MSLIKGVPKITRLTYPAIIHCGAPKENIPIPLLTRRERNVNTQLKDFVRRAACAWNGRDDRKGTIGFPDLETTTNSPYAVSYGRPRDAKFHAPNFDRTFDSYSRLSASFAVEGVSPTMPACTRRDKRAHPARRAGRRRRASRSYVGGETSALSVSSSGWIS